MNLLNIVIMKLTKEQKLVIEVLQSRHRRMFMSELVKELEHRDICMIACTFGYFTFNKIPEKFMTDVELIKHALKYNNKFLNQIPKSIINEEFVLFMIDHGQYCDVPEEFINEEMIIYYVRSQYCCVEDIPKKYINKKVILELVNRGKFDVTDIPKEFIDKEVLIACINKSHDLHEFVEYFDKAIIGELTYDDININIIKNEKCRYSKKWESELIPLLHRDIIIKLVNNEPRIFIKLPNIIQNDVVDDVVVTRFYNCGERKMDGTNMSRNVIIKILSNTDVDSINIPSNLENDMDVINAILSNDSLLCGCDNEFAERFIVPNIPDNLEDALQKTPCLYRHISNEKRLDIKLSFISLMKCGDMLEYAPDNIKNNKMCVFAALSNDYYYGDFTPEYVIGDKELCLKVIKCNGLFECIIGDSMNDLDFAKQAVSIRNDIFSRINLDMNYFIRFLDEFKENESFVDEIRYHVRNLLDENRDKRKLNGGDSNIVDLSVDELIEIWKKPPVKFDITTQYLNDFKYMSGVDFNTKFTNKYYKFVKSKHREFMDDDIINYFVYVKGLNNTSRHPKGYCFSTREQLGYKLEEYQGADLFLVTVPDSATVYFESAEIIRSNEIIMKKIKVKYDLD